MSDLPFGKHFH